MSDYGEPWSLSINDPDGPRIHDRDGKPLTYGNVGERIRRAIDCVNAFAGRDPKDCVVVDRGKIAEGVWEYLADNCSSAGPAGPVGLLVYKTNIRSAVEAWLKEEKNG